MASEKFGDTEQTIAPSHFDITWGNDPRYWRLPTQCDPTAELIKVYWLEVKAKTNINFVNGNKVGVRFVVSATESYSGFTNADIRIGAKVGEGGNYQYKNVSLDGLKVGEVKQIDVLFTELEEGGCDNTIHVGLFDIWSHGILKQGLKFYDARVTQSGPY